MLIPHRTSGVEEGALPSDYRRILAAVRQGAGPVMARQVGEMLGVDISARSGLEPLRGKLVRLADRGRSHDRGVCMCRSGMWSSRRRARH